jgi:hypothetical protein
MISSFTKFLAENFKRTHRWVKILFGGIVVLALLVPLNYINLYFHINSGGLKPSGEVCFYIYFGFWGITFLFYIFTAICIILSFFKTPRITNLILSIVGAMFIYSLDSMCVGDKMSHFFGQPKEEDIARYYAHNVQAINNLREVSKKITLLDTKNDFIFTEQSIRGLSDSNYLSERYHCIFDPDFDFYKNLLGLKPSQINKNTVLLFQSKNDKSPLADANDISAEWHYYLGSLIVFGDGRIEFVKKENFKNLRWQP